MNNEKLKLRRETTNAVRYSSDEEASDRESKKRHNRATIAAGVTGGRHSPQTNNHHNPMPPPIMTAKRTSVLSRSPIASTSSNKRSKFQKPTTSSVYVSPVIQGTSDTEEESDFASNSDTNSTFSSGNYRRITIPNPSSLSPLRPSAQGVYTNENSFIGGSSSSFVDATGSSLSYRRPYNGSSGGGTSSSSSLNGQHSSEAPFVSDFTKRLLNLRGTTLSEISKLFKYVGVFLIPFAKNSSVVCNPGYSEHSNCIGSFQIVFWYLLSPSRFP